MIWKVRKTIHDTIYKLTTINMTRWCEYFVKPNTLRNQSFGNSHCMKEVQRENMKSFFQFP